MEFLIYFVLVGCGVFFAHHMHKRTLYLTAVINDLKLKIRSIEGELDFLKVSIKLLKKETMEAAPTPSVSQDPIKPVEDPKVIFEKPVEAMATRLPESPISVSPTASVPLATLEPTPIVARIESPDELSKLISKIQNYFMSGNTLVKVGVLLIFFGISFLLKYAIDNNIIPIELRLIAAAGVGLVLTQVGWKLRDRSREYGLILQGGGIGVLILTTFVSYKMYGLLTSELTFLLLFFFSAANALLAVKQDSMNLAAFGLVGGFLAPVLASSGQGQHVILFSYYTILNIGIVYMSYKKAWRELNLIGFVFTFVISSLWGVLKYQPEFYATTQPFLIFFFLIYIAIPLLFADKKEPELRGYVDGTLVFGNSLITIVLQLQLVKGTEFGGAYSALALAAFYIFLNQYLVKHRNKNYQLLAEAFISIGVVFTSLAIPLAFDGMKTSAIWALEAAGLYWVAIRQKRTLARYFSTFLIFATSVSFFLGPSRGTSDTLFLNTFFFSCIFMTVGSYIVSYLSERNRELLTSSESAVATLTLAMGTAWWVFGGLQEIDRFISVFHSVGRDMSSNVIPAEYRLTVQLIYLSTMMFILYSFAQKYVWDRFRYLSNAFVFLLLIAFFRFVAKQSHPFASLGFLGWGLAFFSFYYILFQNDKIFKTENRTLMKLGHAGALWVLVGVLVREVGWFTDENVPESSAWEFASEGVIPMLTVWLITEKERWLKWPVGKNYDLYLTWGLAPIVTISWIWLTTSNWMSGGNANPLPFVTILNPLELSHIGMLFVTTVWVVKLFKTPLLADKDRQVQMGVLLGSIYFIWLNGVLCRSIHQYMGVPFEFDRLFASVEVQVGLSIFWSILGIAIMIFGSKKLYRWVWITGASLLGVVVLKMLLIDLSKTETLGRVVSFIIVGILFLIVGYFSPIPPKKLSNEGT